MGGRCIYCLSTVPAGQPTAHVFPEAIVASDLVMPDGSICAACNSYFGETLDPVLVAEPMTALCIQLLGLPGKRGPRARVGPVRRRGDKVILQIDKPTMSTAAGGREATISIRPDYSFDPFKYSRALHCIGLNVLAMNRGCEHALKPYLDAARSFIRAPVDRSFWPWVRVVETLDPIRPEIRARLVVDGPGDTVLVRIFNADYYVDLTNRGGLPLWADNHLGSKAVVFNQRTAFQIRPRSETWRTDVPADPEPGGAV